MDLRAAPLIAFVFSIDVHSVHNSSFSAALVADFAVHGCVLTTLACEPAPLSLDFQE
jgi:TctA family transporter